MRFSRLRFTGAARALLVSTMLTPFTPAALATEAPLAVATSLPMPPAPDQKIAPEAYDHWQKFVATPYARGWVTSGQALPRAPSSANSPAKMIDSAPAQPGDGGSARAAPIQRTSENWSGAVFLDEARPQFKVEAIIGEYVVPNVHQPLGDCGDRHSSYWVGIDGSHSHTLLQAGVGAKSECQNGIETPKYGAWIEWWPADEIPVSRPKVRPGDLMFVEVWSVTPMKGYAYLYNHSLREGAVYMLAQQSPSLALKGLSVEWIVERPSYKGKYRQLSNYSAASWPFGVAWNHRSKTPAYYYPGSPRKPMDGEPPPAPLYLLRMLDDNGKVISTPTVENDHFLFFQNSGSSASAHQ